MEQVFICQNEEGDVFAEFKSGVDALIKASEENDTELDFKVIAKIKPIHLQFKDSVNPANIEWYEKGEKTKEFIDKVILQIMQLIR